MALVTLGDRLADWDTREKLVFPEVRGRKDRSYLFFLNQANTPVETANQYLGIVVLLKTSFGTYQTPLKGKYFPGLDGLVFAVGIPDADWRRRVDMQIVLLPREFKKGTATVKQMEIELSYDDEALRNVVFPAG